MYVVGVCVKKGGALSCTSAEVEGEFVGKQRQKAGGGGGGAAQGSKGTVR